MVCLVDILRESKKSLGDEGDKVFVSSKEGFDFLKTVFGFAKDGLKKVNGAGQGLST